LLLVFGVVVGLVIAYLLWDANKSAYDRMCHILSDKLHEE
jgi:cbb3-type cytochrome oxidase subunit 3